MSLLAPEAPSSARDSPRQTLRRSARHDRLALLIPALIAGGVTLFWFPFNRFMAAGDITPFIRRGTATELFSLWNHRSTGTGGTSAPVARLFEVGLIRVTGWFGGSEMVAQHIQYALVLGFAAFAVAYLARAFVDDPTVVAIAGLFGVFNPFVLVHLPNLLPVLWIGIVAALSGMVLRAARGRPVPPLLFAVASLAASYLSVNPPLLATAGLTVLAVMASASLLVGPGGFRRASRFVLSALPWVVLFNLWWLVPTVVSTVQREGVTLSAQTRVQDWSWSHAQNSLTNVVTLKADWGWRFPEYTPFARGLDQPPVAWLRWILPGFALAAPFLTRGRQRTATFALLGGVVAVILVAKGLHPPFTTLNLWMYENVPGLWLLREPMSKVGGILVLIEVVLAACTLAAILRRLRDHSMKRRAMWAGLLGALVCLALVFPYPVWTGAVGSDGKHGLPTATVKVPDEWRTVGTTINSSPTRGKVLVLPLDRYYQVTTDWGFHGADELVQQLVDRPVLQLLPDGYFAPGGDAAAVMKGIEAHLLRGDGAGALALMRVLGVSDVLVRTDVLASETVPRRADVGALVAALEGTRGVSPPQRLGVANLYTIAGSGDLVRVPQQLVGIERDTVDGRVDAMSRLPEMAAAVSPGKMPIDSLSWETSNRRLATRNFSLRSRERYSVGLDESKPRTWRTDVNPSGARHRLDLVDPMTVVLDGQQVPTAPTMSIPIVGRTVQIVGVNGALTVRNATNNQVALPGRSDVSAYAASGPPARGRASMKAELCGSRPDGAPLPRATPIDDGIRLHAAGGVGCATIPGPSLSPDGVYRLRMQTRSTSTAEPNICLWARGPNRCLDIAQPPATFGWSTHDVAFRSDPGTTGLVLYLYAKAERAPATIDYRRVTVTPERLVGGAAVAPEPRPEHERVLPRGKHQLTVAGARTTVALRADTPLGDCQNSDDGASKRADLSATRIPNGVRLGAAAHSACVSVPIPSAVAGTKLDLGLEVRAVSGRRPRICLWQDGPNECAEMTALPATRGWTKYQSDVTLVPGTARARVYLYADGQSAPRTVAEYRNLEVRSSPREVGHVTPITQLSPAPSVKWKQRGSDSFSAATSGATAPFLLVLNESYADGWKLSGASAQAHDPVDGYANGWYVNAPGVASIDLRYGPARVVRMAYWISGLALLGAAGLVIFRRIRRSFPGI